MNNKTGTKYCSYEGARFIEHQAPNSKPGIIINVPSRVGVHIPKNCTLGQKIRKICVVYSFDTKISMLMHFPVTNDKLSRTCIVVQDKLSLVVSSFLYIS